MNRRQSRSPWSATKEKPFLIFLALFLTGINVAYAANAPIDLTPGIQVLSLGAGSSGQKWNAAIQVFLGLTVLSLAPGIIVSATSFIRIVVVLSMLRHAIGMQETPPNAVLVSLALILTAFTMRPVIDDLRLNSYEPLVRSTITEEVAFDRAQGSLKKFLLKQTREKDIALMVELSGEPMPESASQVSLLQLVPAFIINELRVAFQIGFVVFVPFLLIDLVVSAVLMALGMMMVPPSMISLPLKILMFVLIDGWGLVVKSLVASFKP
jgi:flagellar biosynthetic protein FliP